MNANEALKIFQEGKKAKEQELMIGKMPRYVKGTAPSGVINKAPHIDSNFIDQQIKRGWTPLSLPGPKGPQLFPLSQGQGGPQDQLMAGKPANMPQYIFESIQRQYGNKKYGEYTIEDKKNVINWYKSDAGGGDQNIANVWAHETPSDTFNRLNYPGKDASDSLRINHMRQYHDMKKKELAI